MNAQNHLRLPSRGLFPQGALAVLALVLAVGQSGCCCFDCIPHGTSPLKYIPPVSALTPRNPPCSYVDPMCYGYHATCWRSWPAECVPDCLEWCQQDALGIPTKGEPIPSLAPMPPVPPMPQEPPAPEPVRPAVPEAEPKAEPASESSSLSPVRQAADYAALPPIVSPGEIADSARLPVEGAPLHSSRRSAGERRGDMEYHE